ncbi:MAG: 16S rRNA (cytidine(1402)-2'-O)-methyltransferase [Acidimicrobiales bacterium]
MSGVLVVVGTPIGNLEDLSPRGAAALAAADVIACEDTRRTGRLVTALGLGGARYLVVNEHTEADAADDVVAEIRAGHRVALVTDAGMPGVSDPGERVVAAVAAAGLPMEVVPGPSAVATAVAVSGFGGGRFVFEGFLPRRGRARSERLAEIAVERRVVVVYESPHRLGATLADMAEACGGRRRVLVARELTKLHEELWRGTLDEAREHWTAARGEVVIVVEGAAPPAEPDDAEIAAAVSAEIAAGASKRDAARAVAERLGVARRRAYDAALGG